MKRGKYSKFVARKPIALLLALAMVMGVAIGGTIAWLTDSTDAVTNTFTTSDVEISLEETTGATYKMIPGWTITKDPKVTVAANSEDCYLFVKAAKSANFDDFMDYDMAAGWTQVPGETDVYYRVVEMADENQVFEVILNNTINVLGDVTKDDMDTIGTNPTLNVTAYAVQLWKTNEPETGATDAEIAAAQFTVADAWALVKPVPVTP